MTSMKKQSSADASLISVIKGPVGIGAIAITIFFAGFIGWSAVAPLASATIAPGVVSPDGHRRTVQHLEGGIVDTILVRNGDYVAAGQPLVRLSDTAAHASYSLLNKQRMTLAAQETRLMAEQGGAETLGFPEPLAASAAEAGMEALLDAQREMFETRRAALGESKAILNQQIQQLQQEIGGLEGRIESISSQLGFLDEEIAAVGGLVDKGLAPKPRLLGLKRDSSRLEGERATARASIARARQAIGEARLKIINADTRFMDQVANQLGEVRSQLATLGERLAASRDILERTRIAAPVDGRVVDLGFHTVGAVIQPGEPIMDIVPANEEMVIDVRIPPTDIEMVREGLDAQVHLLAYKQRHMPRIDGRVIHVSADSLTDENTDESYFLARISIDAAHLAERLPDVELVPGMPAEALILTGEGTLLEYLVQPLEFILRRGMRES